ncbi:MAG: aminotransferase class V-fold PLP-dependent enzyme [Defluviitaleaceae bacterium]|nr:aminotransferase class V-fold PLP-dependent enzyme [Defluviitaleaceae bacterium]
MINLDNASTTPAFPSVVDEVVRQLKNYGSIGRGSGKQSRRCTEIYERGRDVIKKFFGADHPKYTAFYTAGTTDGMNKLASSLTAGGNVLVVSTRMEHHANDLPWKERAVVEYVEVDGAGRLILDDFEKILSSSKYTNMRKYVTVTAASNVTGYVNPVHAIARVAHRYGARIIVDGAQIAAHRQFSMIGNGVDDYIDFFLFSAHKMYSPFGGGAVVGLIDVLNAHKPQFYGGGTVTTVEDDKAVYANAPYLYEAGSPNFPAVVGLQAAMEKLTSTGFARIQEHEQQLMLHAIQGLQKIKGVTLFGDNLHTDDRIGIIPFKVAGILPEVVAGYLAEKWDISLRSSGFCAHPYVRRLTHNYYENGMPPMGMLRASLGIHNSKRDIDTLISAISQMR